MADFENGVCSSFTLSAAELGRYSGAPRPETATKTGKCLKCDTYSNAVQGCQERVAIANQGFDQYQGKAMELAIAGGGVTERKDDQVKRGLFGPPE